MIHDDKSNKIGKGENYSLFYNYNKNFFSIRDAIDDYKEENSILRRWLLSSFSYIQKTFGDNFNIEIFMDIETPFESYNPLNESYHYLI